MLRRDEAKAITDKVFSLSRADEVQVLLRGGTSTNIRFARNAPSTSGSAAEDTLTVAATFGTRTGRATINQLDDDSLARVVRRAEDMARLVPEDAEHVPALGPQPYAEVPAYIEGTAARGAEDMAGGVATCIEAATRAGVTMAGYAQTDAGYSCIATSRGLLGYHRATSASLAATARTADATGSGWASAVSRRSQEIDAARVAATAIAKAQRSASPRPIEPGSYVTILEPACVANLVSLMMYSMDTRRADEGRSYFAAPGGGNRKGETLFGPSVSIHSDPMDTAAPGAPWGADGMPQVRRSWIDRGVLTTLATDRYWASKTDTEPVPTPSNVLMAGGGATLDELVASTRRGLLVTSLWYIRMLDPRSLMFTGLTRDGVFWIEDGAIAYPVTNLRWNESPISVLKNIEGMTRAERVPPRAARDTTIVVPALKVKAFTFSSVSDAI